MSKLYNNLREGIIIELIFLHLAVAVKLIFSAQLNL